MIDKVDLLMIIAIISGMIPGYWIGVRIGFHRGYLQACRELGRHIS